MGQKPNYNFERNERNRRKAEKKAAKAKAKAEKAELAKTAVMPAASITINFIIDFPKCCCADLRISRWL